jgi:thioredoxin-related protein
VSGKGVIPVGDFVLMLLHLSISDKIDFDRLFFMRNAPQLYFSVIFFLASGVLLAQDAANSIQWMSWEEAVERSEKEPRKFLVDIYTDWCGWCKRMDATTFQEPHLAAYINQHYYPIKFNAEQREEISFRGKSYEFVNKGKHGYHELAAEITQGRLGYPTLVFLNEDMEVIQAINGYREPLEFEQIVTYFGGDYHRRMPWERYTKFYEPLQAMPAAVRKKE